MTCKSTDPKRTKPENARFADLVSLRDEIAMHALNGLIINGRWGARDATGKYVTYATVQEYTNMAYRLADEMLASRERVL